MPDGLCDEGFFCRGGSFQQRPYDQGTLVDNGSGTLEYVLSWVLINFDT